MEFLSLHSYMMCTDGGCFCMSILHPVTTVWVLVVCQYSVMIGMTAPDSTEKP